MLKRWWFPEIDEPFAISILQSVCDPIGFFFELPSLQLSMHKPLKEKRTPRHFRNSLNDVIQRSLP